MRPARRPLMAEPLEDRRTPAAADLDPTFNGTGIQIGQFGTFTTGDDTPYDTAWTADNRLVVVGGRLPTGAIRRTAGLAVYDAAGKQTTGLTFDFYPGAISPPGTVTYDSSVGTAVDTFPDGRAVVAGVAGKSDGTADIGVAVFTATGGYDTGFNGTGKATVHVIGAATDANLVDDVLVLADGRIAVAGESYNSGLNGALPFVAVFTQAGVLDPTFSGDGVQTLPYGSFASGPVRIAQTDGGRIYLSGVTYDLSFPGYTRQNGRPFVYALTAAGDIDQSFNSFAGANDVAFTDPATTTGPYTIQGGLTVSADGRAVVATNLESSSSTFDVGVAVFDTAGQPDAGFFSGGRQQLRADHGGTAQLTGRDIDTLANGDFAALVEVNGNPRLVVLRPDGTLDAAFGTNGVASYALPGTGETVDGQGDMSAAVRGDGRVSIVARTQRLVGSTVQYRFALFLIEGFAPNLPPLISDIPNQTVAANGTSGPIPFTVFDVETPAAALTLTSTSFDTTLLPPSNIVFGGSGGNRTVTVTPAAGQSGTATVFVTVTDGNGGTATDSFVVTVPAPPARNTPPTATADTATTTGGTPVTINVLANDTDPDNDALTLTGVTPGTGGTPAVAGSQVTFTPAAGFAGTAAFSYTVADGRGGNATAAVAVTVTAPPAGNRAPTANADTATTTSNTAVTIDVLANDSDPDGDALTIVAATAGVGGTPTVTGNRVAFTPATGFAGTATFTYTVADGRGGSSLATVDVTVTSTDPPPSGTFPPTVDLSFGHGIVNLGSAPAPAFKEYEYYSKKPRLSDFGSDKILFQTYSYTGLAPALSADGRLPSTHDEYAIPATGPTFGTPTEKNPQLKTTDEGGQNDPFDRSTWTPEYTLLIDYYLHVGAEYYILSVLDDTVESHGRTDNNTVGTYISSSFFNQVYDLTGYRLELYGVTSPLAGGQIASVRFQVQNLSGIDSPPVPVTFYLSRNKEIGSNDIILGYAVAPATTVHSASTPVTTSFAIPPVTDYGDIVSGAYYIRMVIQGGSNDRNGANDSSQGLAVDTLAVTVTAATPPATNHPPVATADTTATTAGTPVTVDVLANDSDPDNDTLTLIGATAVSGGTPSVSNGRVVFTPAAGFSGPATFTYTISDGKGLSATGTVTVSVATGVFVNTPPVANADAASTPFATAKTIAVLANDTDADGNPVRVIGTTNPADGRVGVNADGSITYTPNAGFSGTDTFTYSVTDDRGGTATAAVTVVVAPPVVDPRLSNPGLVGVPQTAIGTDGGVRYVNADFSPRYAADPLPGAGARTAAADFNRDGVPDVVVGTGPGVVTGVVVLNGATQAVLFRVQPFEASFTGGVYVAAGDVDGDGLPDLVVTPDEGGGPRVDLYRGGDFAKLTSFFGIDDPNFRGGARASIGDLTGDGAADLLVVAGFGGGPRVAGFDGRSLATGPRKVFNDFFAFEQTLRNGVFVAAGDVDGDGYADLIAGGGPGGGPRVTAFSGQALLGGSRQPLANFFAGDVFNRGGIRVAVKDLNGDARADLVVGPGPGGGSRVTAYYGGSLDTPAFGLDVDGVGANGVFVG